MIPRDCEPIGHIPPLPRIDLNPPPRPIAQVPMRIYNPFMEAMAPKADNPRLDPNLLSDRSGTATGRSQKNNPRSLQIALLRQR